MMDVRVGRVLPISTRARMRRKRGRVQMCMNFLRMYIWKSSKEEIVACVGKGKEK